MLKVRSSGFVFLMLWMLCLSAQEDITTLEYFIDTDPGPGNGTSIAVSPSTTQNESFSINTDALSPGYHILGIRARNAQNRWSMYERRLFLIQDPTDNLAFPRTVATISSAEYFIDTDPGPGNGSSITTAGGTTINESFSIATGALSTGYHLLGVRTQNAEGRWSMYERRLFLIQDPQNDLAFPAAVSSIANAEYFIDADPGIANGTPITTSGGATISESFNVSTGALSPGYHILGVRTRNANNRWSLYERRLFLIQDPDDNLAFPKAISNISAAEYFIDNDPGVGNATSIPTSGGSSIIENINVNTDALSPGYHVLGVRTQSQANRWSMYERRLFLIQDPQNDIDFPGPNRAIDKLEFFVDDDPGQGNGIDIPLDMPINVLDLIDLMVDIDPQIGPGLHTFAIRARNEEGSWGFVETTTFELTNAATPIITSDAPDFTNNAEVTANISFGQEMTGFEESDIETLLDNVSTSSLVRNGSLTDLGNGDFSFTVDLVDEGEIGILIPNAAANATSDATASLASDTLRFVYDVTEPIVTVDAVSTFESTPTLTGTVDDLTATVEIEIQGVSYPATVNPDNSWEVAQGTIATLAVGTYDAIATATDLAGNSATDATIDEVSILNPPNPLPVLSFTGGNVSNQSPWDISVEFGAEVTGFEEADIVTLLNQTPGVSYVQSASLVDNADGSFDFVVEPVEGEIAILIPAGVANALSGGGATLASDTLRIEFDISAPNITVDIIATGDTSPELTGTIDDLSATVNIEIDGNNYPATVNADNTWTVSQGTLSPLALGAYDVVATATDLTGNVGTDSTTDEVDIISLSNPLPVLSYTGNSVSNQSPWTVAVDFGVSVSGFDVSDIVTLLNDNAGTSYVQDGSLLDNGNGNFDFTINPVEGEIAILIPEAAVNAVSDGGESQASDTLRIVYDVTEPMVTIDALSTANVSPELTGTVDDLSATIDIEIDGSNYPATVNTDNTWNLSEGVISSLSPGVYDVIATATDLAGNNGTDSSVDEVEIITLTSGISMSDSLALVAFYTALDGQNWTNNENWLADDQPIKNWFGVTLNTEETQIRTINLADNGLSGTVPLEVNTLDSLVTLNLAGNSIKALATDFAALVKVTLIDLSENMLDFGDLEAVSGNPAIEYADQQDIDAIDQEDLVVRVGTGQLLTTTTNGSANMYQWTFNGTPIDGASASSYTIASMSADQVGTYGVVVSNTLVPGLDLSSRTIEILANAVVTVNAVDGQVPISEPLNGYLFSLNEAVADTVPFPPSSVQSPVNFPEVLLGNYFVAVESTLDLDDPNLIYIPTFYGDALSSGADTLRLVSDTTISIAVLKVPEPETGDGVVSGTIDEDFPEDESRVDARRRAKKRKCGLRRRRTGGRTGQADDDFELIAYGETNDNGEFEYGFLPSGTYRFFVEYPGIPLDQSAFIEFEIGEAGVSDTEFVLAVFASPEGITIEIVLGITTDYFVDFSIYPNPTTDLLILEYAQIKLEKVQMEITNLQGQVLFTKELDRLKKKELFDTSILRPGQYFVRFSGGGNTEPLVYKIVKK